jgi:hypothetical protein
MSLLKHITLDDIPALTTHQILCKPDDMEYCLTGQFSGLRALQNDAGWRTEPPSLDKTKGAVLFSWQEDRAWVATAVEKSSKAPSK